MDGPPQQYPSQEDFRISHTQRKSLSDARAPSNGVPVPRTRLHGMNSGGGPGPMLRGNGFAPRSPPVAPSSKNTKHVPCKFFRQGTCTAGDACPYSHNSEPLEPCKFFLNGNCKYGPRCALPHILDGRIINPQCFSNAAGRSRNGHYGGQHPRNAPPNGFPPGSQDPNAFPFLPTSSQSMRIPTQHEGHMDFGSPPGSPYGSPIHDSRMPLSPAFRGFSALDAPLPASYNSQDVPNIARFGPNANSVPVKSGWGPLNTSTATSSHIAHQHHGGIDPLVLPESNGFPSSPPHASRIEAQPRQIMHSSRRYLLADPVSSSMPAHAQPPDEIRAFRLNAAMADHEEEGQGEEFLPSSLSDLLTEKEKMRRFSRSAEEDSGLGPGPSRSSFGSHGDSKVGSPSYASPSRFGPFFASQQAKKDALDSTSQHGSSPFGHVGSPLRNSSLHPSATKPRDFSGSPSFGPISPPRSNDRREFVSSLSEQLKGMRVSSGSKNDGAEQNLHLHSAAVRHSSNPTGSSSTAVGIAQGSKKDRIVSGAANAPRPDEEPCVFSMEDDLDLGSADRRRAPASTAPRRFADVAAKDATVG